MNWITDLSNWLAKFFQWWVIVLPWEKGIRVRAGKYQRLLSEGTYLKLPIIDSVFVQSIRFRYMGLPIQTVTTKDDKTITITGTVGYIITDMQKLYNTIYSPESTISSIAMKEIASFVAKNNLKDCMPDMIEKACSDKLSANEYGLGEISVSIIGFAVVKTYRLISDHSYFPDEQHNNLSKTN